ncbi:HWE histidine kinase domain-containing protein [Phenylobacterium sp.]|uniref:sensor histidine kinase n=1 Tax=Phenylobacterium sp. TaxID=1871053 RepID=UPI0025D61413|nr:HWE histidine kinase domain-containing protein [Phenylobacterium sp.]
MDEDEEQSETEALRERLRRLEAAVEATGLGLWEWDVRSGALTWNDRNRQLFGVSHDRPLTIQHYPELVHPEDREIVREAYLAASEQADGGLFSIEHRTRPGPDGKWRWILSRGRVLKDRDGVRMAVGSNLDITDRKTAEERRSLVLRELAHRAKNGIVVMMTIVAQTAKSATGVKDFEHLLMSRLRSMADSQDLVTQTQGRSLRFGDLLGRALTPFDPGRFDVDPAVGDLAISNEMVVGMALLLHELSTNAVKYGALSCPGGRVKLTLEVDGERARLGWVETGGPAVKSPPRRGFGTRLLDISLRNDGGHVAARFEPGGFEADIHFPIAAP